MLGRHDGPNSAATLPPVRSYVRDGIIIGLATGVFGIAFGVLGSTNGLSVGQSMALSLLVFTGASQFAAVSVIGAGGSPITAVGTALLLGARNAFYGMTMAPHVPGSRLKRLVAAQLTIDESTALAVGQPSADDVEGAFWAGGLSVFLFWNLGTLAGALGGQAIGDPNALGLDAAFPAGFIALMMPALRNRSGRVAALAGSVIAVISIPLTRPGVPILLAALGALIALKVAGPPPPAAPGRAGGEDRP
jgi:4-azaleucine resistance transporter AzlC